MLSCLAGSAVLALAPEDLASVAAGLEGCAARNNLAGSARVVPIRRHGAEVIEN